MLSFPQLRQLATALGRELTSADATPPEQLWATEERLGFALPDAMFAFYLYAGAAPELRGRDRLRRLEELVVEDGYLVFMEENRSLVDWAVHLPIAKAADPDVWQRVNAGPRAWCSKEMALSVFIVKRLANCE